MISSGPSWTPPRRQEAEDCLIPFLPSRGLVFLLIGVAAVLAALCIIDTPTATVLNLAAALGAALVAALVFDGYRSLSEWQQRPLVLRRQLPRAFAVGSAVTVLLSIENNGGRRHRGRLFDMADASMDMPGMPLPFSIGTGQKETLQFKLTPTLRGLKRFEPAQLHLRSYFGLLDLNVRLGDSEARRVFPNFDRHATFAWLTGKQRLAEIGIKSIRRRGSATDFDQLVDYQAGDAIRHIDWKATLKHQRPIVRKFQDDRDQSVMFLLDCGRRMRADDTQQSIGSTHFDQVLNALMLLAFVALSKGDAVGAMTFGTPDGAEKRFAPRKGRHSLNALMAELGDVEPTPTFSDYEKAAADSIRRHRKRGLLVLITNCRDEDATELSAALGLLRSRHLVVLANLREKIVADIIHQPLVSEQSGLETAAALEYQQRRRDMMRRLAMGGVMMIDCEPEQLGVELVNRYTVLKRSGAL
jgi:uncharacterized protein (DUF58 family)